jgi:hypothetical protein
VELKKYYSLLLTTITLIIVIAGISTQPAQALSPWLQGIENKYVIKCYGDPSGIYLKLNNAGLEYGNNWEGARNLATYAVVVYRRDMGNLFPRPTHYAWNAVDAEIHDHCNWALGEGWGYIPYFRYRANPVNIGVNDKPPFW